MALKYLELFYISSFVQAKGVLFLNSSSGTCLVSVNTSRPGARSKAEDPAKAEINGSWKSLEIGREPIRQFL